VRCWSRATRCCARSAATQRLLPGQRLGAGSIGRSRPERARCCAFTRELVALRKRHPSLRRTRFIEEAATRSAGTASSFETPSWDDAEARVLCFALKGAVADEPDLHVMINMQSTFRELPLRAHCRASGSRGRHDVAGAGRTWPPPAWR